MSIEARTRTFYQKMVELCPDIRRRGTFSRAELKEFSAKYSIPIPGPIWENKAGRGLFSIPEHYLVDTPNSINQYSVEMSNIVLQQILSSPKESVSESFIPKVDENYVNFGSYSDVNNIIKSKMFYPVYITGLSGNGKSSMVEQIAAKLKRELIRVNLNSMSDEDQLIGSKTLVNGNVEIVEGPVIIAMRRGAILLIDECDAGSANSLLCLQPILEGKPYYFKLNNEVITPAHGFNIIATANTKGKGSDSGQFIGTNILNEAFLERFGITFEQEYPPQSIEKKIVMNYMNKFGCIDEGFCDILVKWSAAIRRTYYAGGIDEIVSTRRVIHIISAFSIFGDKFKSVELCCNRFDDRTKLAFMDMFKALTPNPSQQFIVDEFESLSSKIGGMVDATVNQI